MELDLNPIITALLTWGLKLVAAIVIFLVGRWLAGVISRMVRRELEKRDTDEAVVRMAATLTNLAVIGLAIAFALGTLGIETAALAALVAALGLAVGLALQGALSNFAGGVLILTFHPFRIGDLVEISGQTGVVEDIQLVNTVLVTGDQKTVIIPNGVVTSDTIINYSEKGIRRVDMVFGIGYDDDMQKAKHILTEMVMADERVLHDPPPTVRVLELADSSVNFAVRPFVKIDDYWPLFFDFTENIKTRFDAEGISIPFPQQDVHLIQPNGSG
ncbi:MAG: mechanosensitive ion channel [Chloroflexota bacterium]|nr:mechanosensitive ion channel [Chloroflexota bacterium]